MRRAATLAIGCCLLIVAAAGGQATRPADQQKAPSTSPASATALTTQPAVITGKVIDATGNPVSKVALLATRLGGRGIPSTVRCISGDDGTFTFTGLSEGPYSIGIIDIAASTGKGPAVLFDCSPVKVRAIAGQTIKNVKVVLNKCGLIKVTVKDPGGNPLPKVYVYIDSSQRGVISRRTAETDQDGVADVRVIQGEYRILAHKFGFLGQKRQEAVFVAEGKTAELTIVLAPLPRIRGIVRDPTSQPAVGATVILMPFVERAKTGKDGRFDVPLGMEHFEEKSACLVVVRDVSRNLSASAEVDVTEPNISLEMTLAPAATLTGRVTGTDGQPIPNARISVYLFWARYGSSIDDGQRKTDAQGRYKVRTLPGGLRYTVCATAEGFGKADVELEVTQGHSGELVIETLVLPPANQTISGVVLDAEDKPIPNVSVSVNSSNRRNGHQPYRQAVSDKDGKFAIDGVVDEEVELRAQANLHNGMQHGFANVKGGDQNVKVVLEDIGGQRVGPPMPNSLLGKPLGNLAALGFQDTAASADGKCILICFFDHQHRACRRTVEMLTRQASSLAAQGVVVLTVHTADADERTARAWTENSKLPFPLGFIPAGPDSEKLAASWGVTAIPWLILTDKDHKVMAEGFTIDQLDAVRSGN